MDETEPLRCIRFVWMLAIGSGEVVCDRKAAAAAAEEREVVEAEFFRNAELAAIAAAEELGGVELICRALVSQL